MSDLEQKSLAELDAEAKRLNEIRKAKRAEREANKGARIEARKTMTACRKAIQEAKAELRDLMAKTYPITSKGNVEDVEQLAIDINETSAALAKALQQFAEAKKTLAD